LRTPGTERAFDSVVQPPTWKVLAPVDLTLDPEEFVQHAIDVTNALAAELTLLYVVDTWHRTARRRADWPPSALSAPWPGPDIHRLVLPGRVPETINRYADFIDADLLLMTRSQRQRRRFWRKSITAEVMNASRRPVCLTDADGFRSARFQCRRILYAAALLRHARELTFRTGAEAIPLHDAPAAVIERAALEHSADLVVLPRTSFKAPRPHCPVLTVVDDLLPASAPHYCQPPPKARYN
jgi:nucleotide-binding universal stress UspA family protein